VGSACESRHSSVTNPRHDSVFAAAAALARNRRTEVRGRKGAGAAGGGSWTGLLAKGSRRRGREGRDRAWHAGERALIGKFRELDRFQRALG